MSKILICGDSFAADWTVKYPDQKGWPNMLAEHHDVINIAQAGCSQYKVLKQVQSVFPEDFDKIIISHTSPYRLPIVNHPLHLYDPLHKDSDLIYLDIKDRPGLEGLASYFENHMDLEFCTYMHTSMCQEIDKLTEWDDVLHMSGIYWHDLYEFPGMIHFEDIMKYHPGLMNHMSDEGNRKVLEKVLAWIDDVS